MSKILGFIGAFVFIVYFYGIVGLLKFKKSDQDKSYAIYGIMLIINISAWYLTRSLIIKYL